MNKIPIATPTNTTHNLSDKDTAATTLSRLKTRSASSTLTTTPQKEVALTIRISESALLSSAIPRFSKASRIKYAAPKILSQGL
ncbi:MAG: hypothetical protein MUF15_20325, partial [Acidobacteria bacterium]|nr:hypothetical protein [Acidobacteriota bacterium]